VSLKAPLRLKKILVSLPIENQTALQLFFTHVIVLIVDMKKLLVIGFVIIAGLFISFENINAQSSVKHSEKALSPLESLAHKRTQRMKDELFLSIDQCSQITQINIEMLKRLDKINASNLNRTDKSKQITQLDYWAKNKIVPLLTPAQRERFESALFAKIYETKVDPKKAYSQKR